MLAIFRTTGSMLSASCFRTTCLSLISAGVSPRISQWSPAGARSGDPYLAVTCQESITFNDVDNAWPHAPSYGWTDITYLLHKYGVSWRYYVATGSLNDCEGTTDETITCSAGTKAIGTPEPWNPLPDFTDVRATHQVKYVQQHPEFFAAAKAGTLPSVSWVLPGWDRSEHPPGDCVPWAGVGHPRGQCGHAEPGLERVRRSSLPGTTGVGSTITLGAAQTRSFLVRSLGSPRS